MQGEHKPPVLVKIAPDLTAQDKQDIADVVTEVRSLEKERLRCSSLGLVKAEQSSELRIESQGCFTKSLLPWRPLNSMVFNKLEFIDAVADSKRRPRATEGCVQQSLSVFFFLFYFSFCQHCRTSDQCHVKDALLISVSFCLFLVTITNLTFHTLLQDYHAI